MNGVLPAHHKVSISYLRSPVSVVMVLFVMLFVAVLGTVPAASSQGSADPSRPDSTAAGPLRLADRLLAVVDDDPIFLSDLRRARALLDMEEAGGDRSAEDRSADDRSADDRSADDRSSEDRLLTDLIDRRLRLHEVDRHTERPVPRSAVDDASAAVEARLGGAESLDAFLIRAELDRRSLRELLRRRLRVLAYVDERLGARIFIDEDDVEAYYDGTLKQEMERRGAELPPLAEVTADIRAVLYQQALNREIEIWTDELRRRAEIQDFRERQPNPADFPPVVKVLEAPRPGG